MSDADHLEFLRNMAQGMNQGSPHAQALKLETVSVDQDGAVLKVPYDEKLIGDPETGVIAGGVVTTLLDHACGQAVHAGLQAFKTIATLDLRVDFLGPPTPEQPVYARAERVKTTRNVAFVRMTASHAPDGPPLATASATYMLSTRGKSVTPKEVATSAMEEP